MVQRPEALKSLKENSRKTLQNASAGKDFLEKIVIAQEIILRIDHRGCIRLKFLCSKGKEHQNSLHIGRNKYLLDTQPTEDCYPAYMKSSKHNTTPPHNNPAGKWANESNSSQKMK